MKHATNKRPENFHLPLSPELRSQLNAEAERTGRPATALAREALESWLEECRKRRLHEEISAYANAVAGTSADLDPALEKAGLELWKGVKKS